MITKPLKDFAQNARRQLQDQVAVKLARVLAPDSIERRTHPDAVAELEAAISRASRDAVIEQVAYTWFNRFIALRYMDVNGYTFMGIVSPAAGFTQPELLQEAKQGLIPDDLRFMLGKVKAARVLDLLSGRAAAPDPQAEAYRLLLVAACNYYHKVMPFMFEEIDDYTELLMPDDLLSPHSILQGVRDALTQETCQDVEVIGWLYQFYISGKKDQVIGSKQKIKPEDIPAATQLFTPHWIVRYLVENSLGRLWLLNHPDSGLRQRMAFYIPPEQPETDFLRVDSPEELRVLDPAAGSGHMLTYAFDLLYAIYEEEGYAPADIPRLILEKNLVGLEIDQRAAALAAFALTMKARARDRRFFTRGVQPDIAWLHRVDLDMQELEAAPWLKELTTNLIDLPLYEALKHDLEELDRVHVIGSLLRPQLTLKEIDTLRERILGRSDLFSAELNRQALKALDQLARLAARYHVVVANPPYMGSGNMPEALKKYARDQYPDSKADLFAMFMERNLQFARPKGLVAMITMQSWMFLSSYEKLRQKLLDHQTILTMAHFGPRAFDTIGGEVVSTTAFVIQRAHHPEYKGVYLRLIEGDSEAEKAAMLRACISNPDCGWFYWASASDIKKISGFPLAYWISNKVRKIFDTYPSLGHLSYIRAGMATGNNDKHVRLWHEVRKNNLKLDAKSAKEVWKNHHHKWVLFSKGGAIRKWYGNVDFVLNYDIASYRELKLSGNHCPSEEFYFRECLTWSDVTTGNFYVRFFPKGSVFSTVGNSIFEKDIPLAQLGSTLASNIVSNWLNIINPTLHANPGDVSKIPIIVNVTSDVATIFNEAVSLTKTDWDSYETSWDFTDLPLLRPEHRRESLAATYAALRGHWREMTLEMQRLEKENNRIFIEAYGLEAELTPDVPIEEITLTCNPHYRYGGKAQANSNQLSVISRRCDPS